MITPIYYYGFQVKSDIRTLKNDKDYSDFLGEVGSVTGMWVYSNLRSIFYMLFR
ncbi:MAG: hypothetical protein CFH05_01436 [Alphaproteobacteria bacterium MarineAlpha3_Bin4]|nr:MAG: hypothetical protein CFH05_01436 [Alphaproteobacteria bacterium MarineAlpha3_Bin4]